MNEKIEIAKIINQPILQFLFYGTYAIVIFGQTEPTHQQQKKVGRYMRKSYKSLKQVECKKVMGLWRMTFYTNQHYTQVLAARGTVDST